MAVRLQFAAKDAPNPIDQHVGRRVRMRRKVLAISQQKLGAALGLTFQQVQKYEKGATRISASRLQQISHILQTPVEFFFEGAPNASAPHGSNKSELWMAQIDDFVSDPDGLRLIGAFLRIDNAALRQAPVAERPVALPACEGAHHADYPIPGRTQIRPRGQAGHGRRIRNGSHSP